jgi:hypothetical protein
MKTEKTNKKVITESREDFNHIKKFFFKTLFLEEIKVLFSFKQR